MPDVGACIASKRCMPEIVVITGGTAGVGRAVARRFAADGAKIAVLARGLDGLRATAAELVARGAAEALAIPCDVADPDQVSAAADRIELELGPIDIWINNAMTTVFGPFTALAPDELRRVTDVTYHGYVWGTRAALAHMRVRDRGTIVQVGSALAYRSMPLQSAYCAAKFAIRGFTDSLRSELRHDGSSIALVMVQLPAVNTPQFAWCANRMPFASRPVPPIYQPDVVACAVHRAAHHPRREVMVGWPTIKAIFGQKLVPGLLDRYLASRGYAGQHTLAPADPHRANNLWQPVPGDHGTHGDFDLRARQHDRASALTVRLGSAGVQALAVVGAAALLLVAAGLVRATISAARS
jgi:NAD(P)-dependent dehydrogenase (short-subunit alcohol dehydrogenase family)